MSRGGFRGRGRGGGRGGMPSIPGMSHEVYREIMTNPSQHTGKLYPPLDSQSVAFLPRPSEFENEMLQREIELEEILRKGVLFPGKEGGGGEGIDMGQEGEEGVRWCGWRLPESRKTVGIEIETYSDLFTRPTTARPNQDQLDPVKLKMDQRFFPPSLWDAYFAPEKEVKRVKAKAGQPKKRKRITSSDDEEKPDIAEADKSSNAASGTEDEDYEDESDHQDYDANYFDNGEGDDDEGGEDEDGGGGGYDD